VHFVDPNPPSLFRTTARFTSSSVDEPVVWVAVLNLFIQEASECAWARQTTLSALRAAVARAGGQQLELTAQDLSPQCRRRGEIALDVNALRAGFGAARAAFPGAHVRPLIVYADDIDLGLPAQVASAVAAARTTTGNSPALLWTVSFASVSNQIRADRQVAWRYAGDATLADRLGEVAKADLPLRTTATVSSGPVPLLEAAQLETTLEFKVCAISAAAESYPELKVTHRLDRAHPPTATFLLPQDVALPKSAFQNSTFEASVEGCAANCDRYFIREPGDDPYRWNEMSGCALGNR
jgi:hypothetical protein